MSEITLKNGSTEALGLVAATMLVLGSLFDDDPATFYELVMLCRDSGHALFGNARTKLSERALIEQGGQPCESIKNIVLSATSGDGLDMTFGSPV